MTRQEAIHLIEWLQKTPTAKQFYGIIPEELLRYYEEQNPALRIHDFVGRSEQLVNFLLHLNDKELINNHDFDYEKEANEYLKKN